jgi:hypothetical protein
MAAYVTQTAAGLWFWYRLDPADLAVNKDDNLEDGLTILWKGGTEVTHLKAFFERAASHVCSSRERYYLASFLTAEGPSSFPFSTGDIISIPHNSFVKFECFAPTKEFNRNSISLVLTVFANYDKHAENLETLQESIGVSLKSSDLPKLQEDIALAVAASSSPLFPKHDGYNPHRVIEKLGEIRSDLPAILSR